MTAQQQKADSEAALKESIVQNKAVISKVTREDEDLKKEVAELRQSRVNVVQSMWNQVSLAFQPNVQYIHIT